MHIRCLTEFGKRLVSNLDDNSVWKCACNCKNFESKRPEIFAEQALIPEVDNQSMRESMILQGVTLA